MKNNSLILLHGALGCSDQLKTIKQLLSKDYEVFDLNFSGHGGEDFGSGGFGIPTFTMELNNFMDERELEHSHFFGYSMGGYVALNLARKHPHKVRKIFTLGTKFGWNPETASREVKNLNPEKIEEKVPHFANHLQRSHAPNDWKQLMSATADMMLDLGRQPTLRTDDFLEIWNHVRIGIGSEDVMVSRMESEEVAGLLPNGELEVFEGFKHPIEQVDQEVLCKAIQNFIG